MDTLEIYQIDAFTNELFKGNPAAVCPLDEWIDETIMQNIAAENNLSETAFYVKKDNHYEIRWFTPLVEIPLCGHATLATAFVEFNIKNNSNKTLYFKTIDNLKLSVEKKGDLIELDFPTDTVEEIPLEKEFDSLFKHQPVKALKGKYDLILVFENEKQIETLTPDFHKISLIDNYRGIIATSLGNTTDIVCRFFAPNAGIDEDPVTGSAHTSLIPYWSKELGKNTIVSQQISKRTGVLYCQHENNRVKISGEAKLYLKGEIYINS